MISFKNSLFDIFGIEEGSINDPDVILQHENEREPFGEILTTEKGHVVLRVGQLEQKGVTPYNVR